MILHKSIIRHNWKPEYKNIQTRYNNGESAASIAKTYNTNSCIIKNIISRTTGLRKNIIANQSKEKIKNNLLEMQNLYLNGTSANELSNKYNISSTTIIKHLSKVINVRNSSEAQKLATKQGKHNNWIKAGLIHGQSTRFVKGQFAGKNAYNWIVDRSKVKDKRPREHRFFKEVLKERNYTCELTNQIGGKLSVHHIQPVWKYPEYIFDKSNVMVIQRKIHRYFHKLYGMKSDENDWKQFIDKKEYLNINKESL